MTSTYYEYNFKKEPDDSLRCLICLEVAVNPVQHICGRLFCQECIEECGDDPCPNCREESPEYFPDTRGRRDIQKLTVLCSNHKNGCKWAGPLGDLDDHITERCDYSEVACPNMCNDYIRRKDLNGHMKKCPKRQYSCKRCGEMMIYDKKPEHSFICTKKVVKCMNQGCSVTVEREKMSEHEGTCKYAGATCKYGYIGCTEIRRRKDMKHHEEDNKFHLELALEKLQKVQEDLQCKEDELYAAHMMATDFKRQLEVAQDEIQKLKLDNFARPVSGIKCQSKPPSPETRERHPPSQQNSRRHASENNNCTIS